MAAIGCAAARSCVARCPRRRHRGPGRCRWRSPGMASADAAAGASHHGGRAGRDHAGRLADCSIPGNTLYLELDRRPVVIELAPRSRRSTPPTSCAWCGRAITTALPSSARRTTSWCSGAIPDGQRPLGEARATLPPEFTVPLDARAALHAAAGPGRLRARGRLLGRLPGGARPEAGQAWLAHCYAMVGAGRDNAADSGNGAELYVVIGHAPRQLDRNIALVGRVVQGMERLVGAAARHGPLGFYEQTAAARADPRACGWPPTSRTRSAPRLEVLRTDTATFDGAGRGAAQPPRRVVQGAGRVHRPVQRAASRCARPDGAAAAQHERRACVITADCGHAPRKAI